MAQKACSGLVAAIPRFLLNLTPAATRAPRIAKTLPTTCGCVSSCINATNRVYMLRDFSSSTLPERDVTYKQLKTLLASQTGVVIDVREPWELREYGHIPGSINIPLGQVTDALQLKPEEFKETYGGDKPQTTDHIVFSCLAGVRCQTALHTAITLGYKDVHQYAGGWQDWAKQEEES